MESDPTVPKPGHRWPRRLGLLISGFLTIACAVLVLGAFAPSIGYVGVFGSLALSLWTAWFVLLPLIAAVLQIRCCSGATRTFLITLGLLTAFGASIVLSRFVSVARANNVDVPVANAFGFSGSLEEVKPDEVVTYTRDQNEDLTLRIFRPKGPVPSGGWPVVMHIHGGGWVNGDKARVQVTVPQNALKQADQLRQRVAFALSQILVTSGADSTIMPYGMAKYQQLSHTDYISHGFYPGCSGNNICVMTPVKHKIG